ncbi:MAG TPA: very short patch repair endonuclease [Verrucomicrobiae bacterium]|nr:very short patch repair endonuclease [Verrucomicrobiae bacterium]
MADIWTKQKRSQVMSRIRSRGNKDTEHALIKILRGGKINGWRRHLPLMGRPDFTFRRERVVVFVDGCFWHGCEHHCRMPSSNRPFWKKKIARNQQRDRLVTRALKRLGWRVVRFWEHALRHEKRVIGRITRALATSRARAIKRPARKFSVKTAKGRT